MRTFLIYLKMELKRVLRVIPYFLAGATVLTLLLGTVALSAGTLIYGDRAVGKITIGMILPEDGAAARRVLGMLESLDSVGSVCEFVYVDRETGKKGLADGEFYCLMDVPGTFVQDIMNGTNTPVTIIFPEHAGTEAAVLKALTDSAAHTLGVSQAGIYAADELCLANGHPEAVAQVEADLNRIYLRYSASREGYFGKQTVSAAGGRVHDGVLRDLRVCDVSFAVGDPGGPVPGAPQPGIYAAAADDGRGGLSDGVCQILGGGSAAGRSGGAGLCGGGMPWRR